MVLYNSADEAEACLAGLTEWPSDQVEVIAVDNASPRGGLDRLTERWPELTLIRNSDNVGFARAMNQAARLARGRFLLLLNPDCQARGPLARPLADWLEGHPQAGLVGPRLVNSDGSLQTSAYAFPCLAQTAAHFFKPLNWRPSAGLRRLAPGSVKARIGQLDSHDSARLVDYCTGAALMVRKSVWDELDGLDEDYFLYYEEIDFCLRAAAQGRQTWFWPGVEVLHGLGASSDTAPELATLARYRSMITYFAKNRPGQLAALRWLMRLGAAWRHAGAGLRGRSDQARLWRRIYRLAGEDPAR